MLNKNTHIFAQKISKEEQTVGLGQTDLVCYEINTWDARLIGQYSYTLAHGKQEFLQKEILAMKKQGIIFELKSPWTSPVVLVPKKKEKKRIYIDYCKLNTITEKDVYPLPNINEILLEFERAKWFLVLALQAVFKIVLRNLRSTD